MISSENGALFYFSRDWWKGIRSQSKRDLRILWDNEEIWGWFRDYRERLGDFYIGSITQNRGLVQSLQGI